MGNSLAYRGNVYEDTGETGKVFMRAAAFIGDSLVAAELPVDTLTAVVRSATTTCLVAADGQLAVINDALVSMDTDEITLDKVGHYGDPVKYIRNGEQFAKFYLESIKRTGKQEYTLNCLSAIGKLLTSEHYGGLYNGETAAEVMEDVVGGIISYTLDDKLASVPIYGLLPKASRRDNLRDLLFAIGGQIRKDTLGELNIVPMKEMEPYEITADEFYMGGSVTGGNPATQVNVTEHSYMKLANDEVVTLYDGESAAEEMVTPKGTTVIGVLVDFSDPVYDLTVQNAEILESGVNYAVISGSPSAVLAGKKYTHTEHIITRRQKTGGSTNVLNSRSCTLVNLMNSELVADRLMAYYGAAKTIEADIVVTNHKPGDAVTFDDPFGDHTNGFIIDMDLTVSSILKARATLVSGFIPTAFGNYYSHLMVITESGTITIPSDCKGKIRIVLIGGGDGGEAGSSGNSGGAYGEDGGAGGAPGNGGLPGKVFVATVSAQPGQTFQVIIGEGGAGAVFGGTAGSGQATTFGTYSTENGQRPSGGYSSLTGGVVYAVKGEDGISGAKGGKAGDKVDYDDPYYYGDILCYDIPGYSGEGVYWNGAYYPGGAGGRGVLNEYGSASGGGGGGAAAGQTGGDGGSSNGITTGGQGGAGATPPKAETSATPGSGGGGGHGGGGGGVGGITDDGFYGMPGAGGTGGEGGNGAPGIVLIYY